MTYSFDLLSQKICYDKNGCRYWKPVIQTAAFEPSQLAVILVDVWDRHWCEGAMLRGEPLAGRIAETVKVCRANGAFIVHGPSDTMEFYKDSPARKRALDIDIIKPDTRIEVPDYPLPIDDGDGGSDTVDGHGPHTVLWTRQSGRVEIDEERDIISDEGDIVYSHLITRGIKLALYMGVHTNMCILHRSFAIKEMLRRGMACALVKDLTDSMYNPERPPYVSHDEGTRLVVEFIEKFYCPTIVSSQLL